MKVPRMPALTSTSGFRLVFPEQSSSTAFESETEESRRTMFLPRLRILNIYKASSDLCKHILHGICCV